MERSTEAAELKSGQFQLMVLKLKQVEPMALQEFLADQVAQAPRLLTGAPVVLDLAALPQAPDVATLRELLERARFCGVVPVAVAAESDSEMASLAEAAGLPSITPERKRGRRKELEARHSNPETIPETVAAPAPAPAPAPPTAVAVPTHYQTQPVRSGQQIYARGTDMVLVGTVSAGAEVIADGSLHVYGRLSGKALAGARGERTARIFCLAFDAELVSIAGHFRVFESVPAELKGRPCHLWLNGERLEIQPLG